MIASSLSGGGSGGGGISQGPGTAIADNQVVRGDTSGIQGSAVTITDAGAVLAAAGSAANPSWSYSGDPTTGYYSSGGGVQRLSVDGIERFRWDGNSNGRFYVVGNGNFPGILGNAKSATVPNLCPDAVGDEGTGIGTPASGNLSLIAANVEGIRVTTAGSIFGGGAKFKGRTSSAVGASATELPADKDFCLHKNTGSGAVHLAYNDGGVILSVALT